MYADDMSLTCPSAAELAQFLRAMDDVCTACGLTINAAKTEIMSVDRVPTDNRRRPIRAHDPLPEIVLRGGPVKEVTQFKYLGSILSSDCSCAADVVARTSKAAAAFAGLRHVWQAPARKLPLSSKALLYRTCILPVLLYGCESWAVTTTQLQRLRATHNSCLRQIMGVRLSDRHNMRTIYQACHTAPIDALLAAARLRQLGHVVRMSSARLPKQALFTRPPVLSRPPGGTRKALVQCFKEDCAAAAIDPNHLDALCLDRPSWRASCRALLL